MKTHEVVILGAGPAGLSAAAELKRLGHSDIVILDREKQGGGIPRHCGHTGYGLLQFGRLMTGPDFAKRLVDQVADLDLRLGHTVLKLEPNGRIQTTGPNGPETFQAQKILLALGARETPRSARLISGTRPWGVMNTGALQQFAYLHGKAPFERPIIIGTELVAFSSLLTLGHVGVKAVAMLETRDRITAWRPGDWVARIAFGVPVLTGCSDLTVLGASRVEGISFKRNGRERVLEGDGIIFTGQFRPETGLLTQSHLELDPGTRGPIIDQIYRCTDASYFAAGNLLRGNILVWEQEYAARFVSSPLTIERPVKTLPSEKLVPAAGSGRSLIATTTSPTCTSSAVADPCRSSSPRSSCANSASKKASFRARCANSASSRAASKDNWPPNKRNWKTCSTANICGAHPIPCNCC